MAIWKSLRASVVEAMVKLIRSLKANVKGAEEFFSAANVSLLVGYAAYALGTGLTNQDVDRRVILLLGSKGSGKSFLIKRLNIDGLRPREVNSRYITDRLKPALRRLGIEFKDPKELRKELVKLALLGPIGIEPPLVKVHEINAVGADLMRVLDTFTKLLDDGSTEIFSQDLIVPVRFRVHEPNYSTMIIGIQPSFIDHLRGEERDERMSDRVVIVMMQTRLRGVTPRASHGVPPITFPRPKEFDGDLVRYFLERLYEYEFAHYRLEVMLGSFREIGSDRRLALIAKLRRNTSGLIGEEDAFLALLALEPLRGVAYSLVDFDAFGSRFKRVDRDFLAVRSYRRYPIQPLTLMMNDAGIRNRRHKIASGGPLGKQISSLRKSGYVTLLRYHNDYRLVPTGRMRALVSAVIREAKIDLEGSIRMDPRLKRYVDPMKDLLLFLRE